MDSKQLELIFTFHAPKGNQAEITKLQECVMFALAAIAINE